MSAFKRVQCAAIDKFHDDLRACVKFEKPNRIPRETLLSERPEKVAKIKIKNITPPNVLLRRGLGISPKPDVLLYPFAQLADDPRTKANPERSGSGWDHSPTAPLALPEPRFYRWQPGAKPEDCTPVY